MVKEFIKNKLNDRSDKNTFSFSLFCESCGKEWRSKTITFSKAGLQPPTESKRIIYEALYEREHAQAMNHAIAEAVHYFNQCPVCKRLIDNDCFLICDDLDLCRECAENLQEVGEQASFIGWMTETLNVG